MIGTFVQHASRGNKVLDSGVSFDYFVVCVKKTCVCAVEGFKLTSCRLSLRFYSYVWQVAKFFRYCWYKLGYRSRYSNYATDRTVRGSDSPWGKEFFFSSERLYWLRDLTQHSHLFSGYRGSYSGVKRPEREANPSPLYNAEDKNEWSCTSASPIRPHGIDRENYPLFYVYLVFVYCAVNSKFYHVRGPG
jgi:hypothetical protein